MSWTVEALCAGQPAPFNGAELSAIAKARPKKKAAKKKPTKKKAASAKA